ncbi:MAG: hypothetical protein JXR36_04145 [Bacteroidales bacterium]|nr:hypothetical protein [Bacteroidales bacterium]
MIAKTNAYKTIEAFYNGAIKPLKAIAEKEQDESRLSDLNNKIEMYETLHKVVLKLIYSHSVFITEVKNFHEEMIGMGVYNNGDISLDVLELDFAVSYNRILKLNNFYEQSDEGLITTDKMAKAINLFQETFGVMEIYN